jgi:hypothetical protein
VADIKAEIAAGNSVLVLSQFPVALTKVIRLLSDANVQHRSYSTFDFAQLCEAAPGTVWVGLARAFQPTAQISGVTKCDLTILVLEHHPRRSEDQALLDAAATLSCSAEVCFNLSLDDPLLVHFQGEAIQKLFRTMRIDEGDFISNRLITTAVASAQEKMESVVPQDLQAESIEDWFKYNIR